MAIVHCAISGLQLKVSHGSLVIPAEEGYYHPIFALPYKKLFGLYSRHCKAQATPHDSYLLFLAFIHATGQVKWKCPACLDPTDNQTKLLVENNIHQLITVLEQTSIITVPSFRQPSFILSQYNNDLSSVHNWIKAWQKNIADFREGYRQSQLEQDILKVENKLSWLIKSGLETERYADVVATWAAMAGDFPKDKKEHWKQIIRSVFNDAKMFAVPQQDLRDLKAWVEDNIEPGSIHFHTLYAMLKTGISNNANFLGLSSVALGYQLIDVDSSKTEQALEILKATAPPEFPKRTDYPSEAEFIKAKLKFRIVQIHAAKRAAQEAATATAQATTAATTATAQVGE